MERSAAPTLHQRTDTVTTAELLASQLQGAAPVEVGTRILTLCGVPVAEVTTNIAHLNPTTATSSEGMPAVEMLAALAGHEPSGVLLVESMNGKRGCGFHLEKGRLTGACGPGVLGELVSWSEELHARFPERTKTPPPSQSDTPDPQWKDLAREFVYESALEALRQSSVPGTRITLLRGDLTWQARTLPLEASPSLQHLLMEQARREDELPRMLDKLGDQGQLALPMYEPGPLPPGGKPSSTGDSEGWGDAEPDSANKRAWDLARTVFRLCDGQRSLRELSEFGLLGEFRTLEAIILLAKSQCVIVVDAPSIGGGTQTPPDAPKILEIPRPGAAPTPAMPDAATGYSITRQAKERISTSIDARPPAKVPRAVPHRPARSQRRPLQTSKARTPSLPPKAPTPQDTPASAAAAAVAERSDRIPTRTRVEPHAGVVTAKPPSVRDANVGGGRALLATLEAELAAIDSADPKAGAPTQTTPAAQSGGSWQYMLLAILGALLFAGGAAFSMMLG
ncbi:MAG: hypothetical protein ACRBN8_20560 [Nannocystales bacterium]